MLRERVTKVHNRYTAYLVTSSLSYSKYMCDILFSLFSFPVIILNAWIFWCVFIIGDLIA